MVPPNYLLYVATKGAVEQMSRVLAKDLGAKGITVNTVAPGPIDTDMFRQGKTEQLLNVFAGMHPQKRIGTPEEVANVENEEVDSGKEQRVCCRIRRDDGDGNRWEHSLMCIDAHQQGSVKRNEEH